MKSKREKQLESIILDLYWMARRYADGRRSYAVSMCNEAIDLAFKLGLPIKNDPVGNIWYARDGMEIDNAKNSIDETSGY